MSCQVDENLKSGPVTAHTTINVPASASAPAEPAQVVTTDTQCANV
jgi:hypothetical protein